MTKQTSPDSFDAIGLGEAFQVQAPDGSDVAVLTQLARGSMAHFTLAPGAISVAIAHHTIEELWYVTEGRGRMWRLLGDREEVVELTPGLSLSLPVGTRFQFRNDGEVPMCAVGVAMPPWPGEHEAYRVDGPWDPSID